MSLSFGSQENFRNLDVPVLKLNKIRCVQMTLSFGCIFHFVPKPFFDFKIPIRFTSIVTHAHSIQISHNQALNSDTCGVFNKSFYGCLSITFSSNINMIEL